MAIFASKAAFMQLGVEQVAPSTAHMCQDCYICKKPLDVNIHTVATDAHHQAVRIGVCGHIHGQECLAAWLDAGNSCPTCKRMLFEATGRSVTQSDLNALVHFLRRRVGEARAMAAIARLKEKQDLDRARLRLTHEEDLRKTEAEQAELRLDDLMGDDEWLESEDDEAFESEDDDDKFDMEDSDEDGGVAISEGDVKPGPATP